MKNLENYGVQSLNAQEINGIDGGFLIPIPNWMELFGGVNIIGLSSLSGSYGDLYV